MIDSKLFLDTESRRCLLCSDAPCEKACPQQVPVDDIIRSWRFENYGGAKEKLEHSFCLDCIDPACMKACLRGKADSAVEIRPVMRQIHRMAIVGSESKNINLRMDTRDENKGEFRASALAGEGKKSSSLATAICGIPCENPFLLSSSVVGSNYEMTARAFDMGWAGVAFKTIGMFVPKEVSPRFADFRSGGVPHAGFKNVEQISNHTLEENLGYLKKLKKNYPQKVILASIMGRDEAEWTKLASLVEEAGADVIECNFSCPHMSGDGLGSDVGTHPELVAAYVRAVKAGSSLPVLAKMTPNITDMEPVAMAAMEAGADGMAAINTIKSVLNIDLESFASAPDVGGKSAVGGYSGRAVKPIALRFIYDMAASPRLKQPELSGMGGIETWRDAAEFIALGCSTVQVTTAVMQYGYRIIDDLSDGLSRYLEEHGFSGIADLQGRALEHIVSTEQLNRHTVCLPKFDPARCVGCGRCYLSCRDGGHQAITMGENKKPILNGKKCVGCHLCVTVCPVGAIGAGKRFSIAE